MAGSRYRWNILLSSKAQILFQDSYMGLLSEIPRYVYVCIAVRTILLPALSWCVSGCAGRNNIIRVNFVAYPGLE